MHVNDIIVNIVSFEDNNITINILKTYILTSCFIEFKNSSK